MMVKWLATLYRSLLEKNYFSRQQLAPTTFYRFIRDHDLLDVETTQKLRMPFAMQPMAEHLDSITEQPAANDEDGGNQQGEAQAKAKEAPQQKVSEGFFDFLEDMF